MNELFYDSLRSEALIICENFSENQAFPAVIAKIIYRERPQRTVLDCCLVMFLL